MKPSLECLEERMTPATLTLTGASGTYDLSSDPGSTVNLRSTAAPVTIILGEGANVVNISSNAPTNSGNLAGITSDVEINAGSGANKLTISGFADYAQAHPAMLASGNTVMGLAPATI